MLIFSLFIGIPEEALVVRYRVSASCPNLLMIRCLSRPDTAPLVKRLQDARPNWKAIGSLSFLNEWEHKLGAEVLTPFGRQQLCQSLSLPKSYSAKRNLTRTNGGPCS
jgi:hypothetical protein